MNNGKPDTAANRGNTSYAVYNKNPLNIKPSKDSQGEILNKYPGEITVKGAMHRMFSSYEYGVAAGFIHLWRYMNGFIQSEVYPKGTKLVTIEKIIRTWAPKSDPKNDTEGYIRYVVQKIGLIQTRVLHFDEVDMTALVRAMSPREDGTAAKELTPSVFSDGWAIAATFLSKLK